MKLKHVLVATDLGDQAEGLWRLAQGLARWTGCRLTLFHVRSVAPIDTDRRELLEEFRQRVAAEADARLERVVARLRAAGIDARSASDEAHPVWRGLLSAAAVAKVDMIVAAAGTMRRDRLVLGATTLRLVRHSPVPVLVAPVSAAAQIPEHRQQPFTLQRIMVPTDFGGSSERGLRAALCLAEANDTRVTLVHVITPLRALPKARDGATVAVPNSLEHERESKARGRLETLAALANSPRLRVKLVRADRVSEGLLEAESDADLILIPSAGRGAIASVLLGSTVERVLPLTGKPIVVLPRAYLEESFEGYG